jgi:hypothetical protein
VTRKQWFPLVDLLFLACYLLYSILPLTYAVDAPASGVLGISPSVSLLQEDGHALQGPELSSLSPDPSDRDDAPSPARVLLRKKRAISASSKDLVAKPLARSCALITASDGRDAVVLPAFFVTGGSFRVTGYHHHHSGISPPEEARSAPACNPSLHPRSLPEPAPLQASGAETVPSPGRELPQTPVQAVAFARPGFPRRASLQCPSLPSPFRKEAG